MTVEGETFTVCVLLKIQRRGGRKVVLARDGRPMPSAPRRIDSALSPWPGRSDGAGGRQLPRN
jgi:hypothetical protein